jgi:hypothetical protein
MSICKAERFHQIAASTLCKYNPGHTICSGWQRASKLMEWSVQLCVSRKPHRTVFGLFKKFFAAGQSSV